MLIQIGVLLVLVSYLATLLVLSEPLPQAWMNYPVLAVTIGVGIIGFLMIFGIIGTTNDKEGK